MRITTGLLVAACSGLLVACGAGSGHHASTGSSATPTSASAPATVSGAPVTSVSASPTVSPTATAPVLTGAGLKPGDVAPVLTAVEEQHNASGALGFAAYFYKALDWSIATTNPNLLRAISAPDCEPCQKYITDLDALAASGGHSEGGRISMTKFQVGTGDLVKAAFTIAATGSQTANVIYKPAVAPATYSATPLLKSALYLDWRDGRWQAVAMGSV